MRLLIDLGNTRVKWCALGEGTDLGAVQAHAWDKHLADTLHHAWAAQARPQAVWAASVVDAAREATIAGAVLARFGAPVTWVRTPREGGGVCTAYAEPQTLGVDRFLAMVAARAQGRAPCIIVSAGTALTLDALTGDGRHLGGLIAPGAPLMQQSVLDATARVRLSAPGAVTDVATNTADALASGCWQACAALVDRFAGRMAGLLGGTPQLLIGGGDAAALAPWLTHRSVPYPDAVLKGLAAWSHPDA